MEIVRTEEWTLDADWGISTAVVDVWSGEFVLVDPAIMVEFDLKRDDAEEVVHPNYDKFVLRFPYAAVAKGLAAHFYRKADPVDASA